MTKSWDVVVVGGLNSDYVVKGPRLPKPGETVQGKTFFQAAGGKGANQAVAAARLGARVAFVGRVGSDERGKELLKLLKAEGINIRHVKRDDAAPTGVALIMVDARGEKKIFVAPGANHRLTAMDVAAAGDVIRGARVVLTQFEVPMQAVLKTAHLGRRAGAVTILDPAPPTKVPGTLLKLIDVIRPNSSEAEALTGIAVTDRKSARRAAQALFRAGVKAVAIQAGEKGDLMMWRDGECWLSRLPVNAIDATGAGDAFAAGLAVALAEGRSWAEAGAFANAAAALATTKLGAQPSLPHRSEVIALMSRSGLKEQAAAFRKNLTSTG